SGFDYLDGHVWVRHDPATECPNLLNQLFLCLEVAGIPGDADGDGRINNPTHIAGCGTAIPSNADGDGTANSFPLARSESYTFQIDRDCNGETDLGFRLSGPSPAQVKIEFDNFNVSRPVNVVAGDFALDPSTDAASCPSTDITGHVLIRIDNWDS